MSHEGKAEKKADDKANHNDKGIHKEQADGDVKQHVNPAHKAISRIQVLLGHDRHPPTDAVAEIIAEHPEDQHAVVAWLHEHFGNSYVHKVMSSALKTAKHAEHHDVALDKLNAKADHARSPKTNADDPNRMTQGGTSATLALATQVYRGDGSPFDRAKLPQPAPPATPLTGPLTAKPSDALRIDTGAVKSLAIVDKDGKPAVEECVLVFQVGDQQHVSGWVPVWAIDPAFAKEIKKDEAIDKKLEQRGHEHEKFAHTARHIAPAAPTSKQAGLRVKPNETTDGVDMAEHYCERPGGVVNLLVNVPGGDGSRMGVATDVLPTGAAFFESTTVHAEHTPLWHSGKGADQSDQKLTFVFGRVKDAANKYVYGWINKAMLG